MMDILYLTKRNINVFLRDKTAVFFSMLSVIILLGLYLVFLKNQYKVDILVDIMEAKDLDFLVYGLIMSGVLVINTVTLSLGNLGNIINDIEYKRIYALIISPIKPLRIVIAYFISSFIITLSFTYMMWLLTILFVFAATSIVFSFNTIITTIGLLSIYTLISTAMMILLVTFIKSTSAFGAISGVLGTFIGFLCGVYLPLNLLPNIIQKIARFIPFTHMTIFLKDVFTKDAFLALETKIPKEALDSIKTGFSIDQLQLGNTTLSMSLVLSISCLIAIVCLYLASKRLIKKISTH
ncbi:MAG: ABC transporter permease [Erysipelothrix sp.]|nr:ABC transporter permease [Erysipelothrix sp.]